MYPLRLSGELLPRSRPLAEYEQKLALAALLARGTYTLDEPGPVRNAFRIGTYGPETGVRLTLRP